eukprot:12397847-Karenia_brevis.AAC.1
MQEQLVQAITAAGPKEAKHNRAGYAEWVERILNQREGYRMVHNWTRGTPKAPLPPAHLRYIWGSPLWTPKCPWPKVPQGLGHLMEAGK